jgi:hypothetical protein
MELLELKNKTAKIFKSRGTKIGIIVLAPLLVLALLVVNWAHLYAVGVLAEFSGSDALVAAFGRKGATRRKETSPGLFLRSTTIQRIPAEPVLYR